MTSSGEGMVDSVDSLMRLYVKRSSTGEKWWSIGW